ncbi:MAG: dimethylargininase [Gammaproteobacteria bacterium]|nr:dimethylargininase [Gammaproteobacteria bacterium]
MLFAYTRAVSPRLAECELTHLPRDPVDVTLAAAEHMAYEALLTQLGATVCRLPPEPQLPDGVFVEDTAIVLGEIAVITRPGAVSRRPETASTATALAAHRPLAYIQAPGTLDGGDVLVAGRQVYVGLSTRSNRTAVDQLAELLGPFGYEVIPVEFGDCLHLKSGVTRVADGLMLLNPDWVDPVTFRGYRAIPVDPSEPNAANALALGGSVIHPQHHSRTRARLESEGLQVAPVAMAELAKAEAGVTCCSLLVHGDQAA